MQKLSNTALTAGGILIRFGILKHLPKFNSIKATKNLWAYTKIISMYVCQKNLSV